MGSAVSNVLSALKASFVRTESAKMLVPLSAVVVATNSESVRTAVLIRHVGREEAIARFAQELRRASMERARRARFGATTAALMRGSVCQAILRTSVVLREVLAPSVRRHSNAWTENANHARSGAQGVVKTGSAFPATPRNVAVQMDTPVRPATIGTVARTMSALIAANTVEKDVAQKMELAILEQQTSTVRKLDLGTLAGTARTPMNGELATDVSRKITTVTRRRTFGLRISSLLTLNRMERSEYALTRICPAQDMMAVISLRSKTPDMKKSGLLWLVGVWWRELLPMTSGRSTGVQTLRLTNWMVAGR